MRLERKVTVVQFDAKKHWLLLQLWWSERKFNCPPLELMPQTGYLVSLNDQAVCAGFLTLTDAGVAVMGHFVSDPRVPGEHRHGALDLLISKLIDKAKQSQFKYLFCSTNLPDLEERFKRHGFEMTDSKINVYGRNLCRGG